MGTQLRRGLTRQRLRVYVWLLFFVGRPPADGAAVSPARQPHHDAILVEHVAARQAHQQAALCKIF